MQLICRFAAHQEEAAQMPGIAAAASNIVKPFTDKKNYGEGFHPEQVSELLAACDTLRDEAAERKLALFDVHDFVKLAGSKGITSGCKQCMWSRVCTVADHSSACEPGHFRCAPHFLYDSCLL